MPLAKLKKKPTTYSRYTVYSLLLAASLPLCESVSMSGATYCMLNNLTNDSQTRNSSELQSEANVSLCASSYSNHHSRSNLQPPSIFYHFSSTALIVDEILNKTTAAELNYDTLL